MTGLPAGFTHHVDGDADVIGWSNRRVPKDRGVLVFLLLWTAVWTPATLFLTVMVPAALILKDEWEVVAAAGCCGVPFLLGFWLGEVAAVGTLAALFAREEVRVAADRVEFWLNGRCRDTVPRDRARSLTHERYDDESGWTLNLWPKPGPPGPIDSAWLGRRPPPTPGPPPVRVPGRVLVAYWARPPIKAELFGVLRALFERHGWELEYRNDFAPKAVVPR